MDDKNLKDRRLEKVINLDQRSYESVRLMLSSEDEADRIMGYLTLENINQKKSLIYTLFLRKECMFYKIIEWKTHAPITLKYHDSLGIDSLSHKAIYAIIKKTKNIEFLNFYLYKLSSYIKSVFFDDFQDDLIEDIEIIFKTRQ
jgi:hypothetical protein